METSISGDGVLLRVSLGECVTNGLIRYGYYSELLFEPHGGSVIYDDIEMQKYFILFKFYS